MQTSEHSERAARAQGARSGANRQARRGAQSGVALGPLAQAMATAGVYETRVLIGLEHSAGWISADVQTRTASALDDDEEAESPPEGALRHHATRAAVTIATTHLADDAWYTRGDVSFIRMPMPHDRQGLRLGVHLRVTGPLS